MRVFACFDIYRYDYFFNTTECLNIIVLLTSHQTMEKETFYFSLLLVSLLYKQSVRNNQQRLRKRQLFGNLRAFSGKERNRKKQCDGIATFKTWISCYRESMWPPIFPVQQITWMNRNKRRRVKTGYQEMNNPQNTQKRRIKKIEETKKRGG